MPDRRLKKARRSLPDGYQFGDAACICRVERHGEFFEHYACPTHLQQRIDEAGGIAMFNPSSIIPNDFRAHLFGMTKVGCNVIEGEQHGDEWAV